MIASLPRNSVKQLYAVVGSGITAPGFVMAFALNAGQICYADTRILEEETIYDVFVDAMVQTVNTYCCDRETYAILWAMGYP